MTRYASQFVTRDVLGGLVALHDASTIAAVIVGLVVVIAVAIARRLCANKGVKIGSDAVQLLGGHGYIEEHGMSQFVRDARIAARNASTPNVLLVSPSAKFSVPLAAA